MPGFLMKNLHNMVWSLLALVVFEETVLVSNRGDDTVQVLTDTFSRRRKSGNKTTPHLNEVGRCASAIKKPICCPPKGGFGAAHSRWVNNIVHDSAPDAN